MNSMNVTSPLCTRINQGTNMCASSLERDGYFIFRGVLQPSQIVRMHDALRKKKARHVRAIKCQRTHMLLELDASFVQLLDMLPRDAIERILGRGFQVGAMTANTLLPEKRLSRRQRRKRLANELHIDYPHGHVSHIFGGTTTTIPERSPWTLAALWMLTDFTKDNGATRILPGSHHWRRIPNRDAPDDNDYRIFDRDSITLTGHAGDLILFIGEAWHTICVNESDRERVGVIASFVPFYVKQMENHAWTLSPKVRDRLAPHHLEMLGLPTSSSLRHSTRIGPPRTPLEGATFAYDSLCYDHATISNPSIIKRAIRQEFETSPMLRPYADILSNLTQNVWWVPFRAYRIATLLVVFWYAGCVISPVTRWAIACARFKTKTSMPEYPLMRSSSLSLVHLVLGIVLGTLVTLERLRM